MSINSKIGILGGGQLGRMLIQKAIDFDLNISVLDPAEDCSCRDICNSFTKGDFNNYDDVFNFGKNLDIITIEIENVNTQALKDLQKIGKQIFPSPETIEMIKDKGLQKAFYAENNIPSSPFILCENLEEIQSKSNFLPFAQKLRTGGYDGKGVSIIKSEKDFDKLLDGASVLEKLVDIEKEIAIIAARNQNNEIKLFPVVELVFNDEANLVDYLFAPANISAEIEQQANEIAKTIIEKLHFVGLLAIEMFVDKKGNVLVNEMAPRPHNSGHHTIEANITSQYEQHLRAILNLPLGNTETILACAMVNVLGEKGFSGKTKIEGLNEILKIDGVKPHFYGKKTTKPFRKMGHVTVLDKTVKGAIEKTEIVKNTLKIKA